MRRDRQRPGAAGVSPLRRDRSARWPPSTAGRGPAGSRSPRATAASTRRSPPTQNNLQRAERVVPVVARLGGSGDDRAGRQEPVRPVRAAQA
jgi:hypothetical protein